MDKKFLWLSIVGVLISFAGGFLIANTLNRSEMERIRAENTRLQKQQDPKKKNEEGLNLSDKEIKERLAEAEKNPKEFAFQKGLGLALYQYSAVKQDTNLLGEVRTLLDRAHKINSDDYQVIVSLANINYDLGQIKKDEKSNLRSRELYEKALTRNPKDSNVRSDYGLTFLLSESPDRKKAVEEFEKALADNPKNEKALIYTSQSHIELGNKEKAAEFIAKLKKVNPKSKRIAEFESLNLKQK